MSGQKDDLFISMTEDSWKEAMKPKADGLVNIHNTMIEANQTLDFLISTSSSSAAVDHAGQSNYIAGNLFMEQFSRYRRSLGLPASVIALCPIGDTGYMSERPHLEQFYSGNHSFIYERELLVFIEHAIVNQQSSTRKQQLGHGESWTDEGLVYTGLVSPTKLLTDPTCSIQWRGDPRMASLHNRNLGRDQRDGNSKQNVAPEKMIQMMDKAQGDASILKEHETITQLAIIIGEKLFSLLTRTDENVSELLEENFKHIGLDSLVLMELRGWWRATMGIEISPLELAGKSTLTELGAFAAESLYQKYTAAKPVAT